MPRSTDPAKVAEAVRLEASGMSRREIGERLGVSKWTLIRWLGALPSGRPRVPDEVASERTERRRRRGR